MTNPFVNIKNAFVDMHQSFKNGTKKEKRRKIINIFLLIAGAFVLAFGTAIFLIPDQIPGGGLSGIGVVIQYMVPNFDIDIFVLITTWVLFVIGWMTLGTKFIFKTLIASIVFPLALMLFTRVPIFIELQEIFKAPAIEVMAASGDPMIIFDNVKILLNGLIGGALVGAGVALTFVGGGSTGGVDILYFLLEKYTGLKESVSSFLIDGIIIVVAVVFVVVKKENDLVRPLIGLATVFMSALMIEIIYIRNNSSYVMDIISDKWPEISRYIQDTVGRGVTLIPAQGGYQQEERIILRVVFDKKEYQTIKLVIAEIDPKAFITYTQTEAVFGEGFSRLKSNKITKKPKKTMQNTNESDEKDGKPL